MNTFLLVIQLAILVATLGLCGCIVAVAVAAKRKLREVESLARAFVTAPDGQTPSPLAQTVDQVAQVVARAAIAQAKATFMGLNSGATRTEAVAQRQAAVAQFPWLQVLDKLSPGISKTLVRNPQLLNLAAQFVAKQAGQAPPGSAPAGNGRAQQVQFNL